FTGGEVARHSRHQQIFARVAAKFGLAGEQRGSERRAAPRVALTNRREEQYPLALEFAQRSEAGRRGDACPHDLRFCRGQVGIYVACDVEEAVQPDVLLFWRAAFDQAQLRDFEVLLQQRGDGLGLGRLRIEQEIARVAREARVLDAL